MKKLSQGRKDFGDPDVFFGHSEDSRWVTFTVTASDPTFFHRLEAFTGNQTGRGGLISFTELNWRLTIVTFHQPEFVAQPGNVQLWWGYGLYPDKPGNRVKKPMTQCSGEDILREFSIISRSRTTRQRSSADQTVFHACCRRSDRSGQSAGRETAPPSFLMGRRTSPFWVSSRNCRWRHHSAWNMRRAPRGSPLVGCSALNASLPRLTRAYTIPRRCNEAMKVKPEPRRKPVRKGSRLLGRSGTLTSAPRLPTEDTSCATVLPLVVFPVSHLQREQPCCGPIIPHVTPVV